MTTTQYTERLAEIRKRFATRLVTEIESTSAALPTFSRDEPIGSEAVAAAYRRFHNVCGAGPTIGFIEVGRAARAVSETLLAPYRAVRCLTPDELAKFTDEFATFRTAANAELQSKRAGELTL